MSSKNTRNPVPVIMYHSLGLENSGWLWAHLSIPVSLFADQVRLLVEEGFSSITLEELYHCIINSTHILGNRVVLTFDDGYLDNWVYAYPILKEQGLKATIFVNPEFVDPTEEYRPNLEDVWKGRCSEGELQTRGFLSWREMREVEASRIIDIQSHTMTHNFYFKSNKIIDFHHPGDAYPWLAWNKRPEYKYGYLRENQEHFVPYGTPIYDSGRALGVRRYFEDPGLNQYLVDYVENRDGKRFFSFPRWKEELHGVAQNYRDAHELHDRYETEDEFAERAEYELAESKKVIGEHLNKTVNFLCWPGGAYNHNLLRKAKEVGYLGSINGHGNGSDFDEYPLGISRIGCGASFYWRGRFVSFTSPEYFMAHIKYLQGSKLQLWLMRGYKAKYMLEYMFRRLVPRR